LNGIAWYTDHKELLQHTDVDLVYVAVPPKYHHAIALDVIASGMHILCEKPLANSLGEAYEMLEQAQRAGIVHASNYVSSGYVGQLRRVEIITHFHKWPREWQQNEWVGGREQGGFVLEVIPHFIQ
jgi:predicted dehydrogenase